jgi:hypothetical protein
MFPLTSATDGRYAVMVAPVGSRLLTGHVVVLKDGLVSADRAAHGNSFYRLEESLPLRSFDGVQVLPYQDAH